ncbi:hypothetical protein AVEN_128182-1 [Araneus ventricosus]|uniref:Uncharacterized protein n=1 Tax=Araneus ventricosus TaxID=182803 RepID=A0A4Y2A1Y4_ARAVE|nr:hypothetical protein AVEN_128182-1 [Araneus ventricosus]
MVLPWNLVPTSHEAKILPLGHRSPKELAVCPVEGRHANTRSPLLHVLLPVETLEGGSDLLVECRFGSKVRGFEIRYRRRPAVYNKAYRVPTKVPYQPFNYRMAAAIFIRVVSRYGKVTMRYWMKTLTEPTGGKRWSSRYYL